VSFYSDKKKTGAFYVKTCVHFVCLTDFFLEFEMFQTNVVGKIKTVHLMFSNFFFSKIASFVR
jgi:hypothetical protein